MHANFHCGSVALQRAVHDAKIKALFDDSIPNASKRVWFMLEVEKLLGAKKRQELQDLLDKYSEGRILP